MATSTSKPHVTIGLVTYNAAKYLSFSLPSLLQQNYENFELVILDNNSTDNTVDIIKNDFPKIRLIESKKNSGFGAGHNMIINKSHGEYYFCASVDMLYNIDFISQLVSCIERYPKAASVTGKLLQWDFKTNTKTTRIDSTGLDIKPFMRFSDRGQGTSDSLQWSQEEEIFGCSGAAVLFDRACLEQIAYQKNNDTFEYFDETFFLYKEDLEIATRLRAFGYQAWYCPQAQAHHDRTASGTYLHKRKQAMSLFIRQYSYLNQQLLEFKYYHPGFSFFTKIHHFVYKAFRYVYVLIFENKLKNTAYSYYKLLPAIQQRRQKLPQEHFVKRISPWFHK